MILTITLNPSVDISFQLPAFQLNETNRSSLTQKTAGGKGLNVTRVLHCLNMPVKATGFLGGTNGLFIQKELLRENIDHYFVSITGNTRNCIAVIHDSQQTEILEEGPLISHSELNHFLKKMEEFFPQVSIIVASGSLPKGLPDTLYQELLRMSHHYKKPFLLDTSGEPLKRALEAGPMFIKPNLSEFERLIERKLETEAEIVYALQGFPYPVKYVMVTLGEKGAIVKNDDKIYKISIPKVMAVNPVGSGDATVAGFAAGLFQGMQDKKLFAYSTVMGLLNALETRTGYVNPAFLDRYVKEVNIISLT